MVAIISAFSYENKSGFLGARTSFEVVDCGLIKGEGTKTHFEIVDYVLFYVKNSGARLSCLGKNTELSAGDMIICRPYETKIITLTDDLSEVYFFSFNGRFSTELLTDLRLTLKDKYFVGHDSDVNATISRLLEEWANLAPHGNIVAASALITLLCLFSRIAIYTIPKSQSKGHEKIAPAIESMNSDCTSKLTVDDYAKMCNLSTSYFTHLFTSVTGFSPIEYKQFQRINIAKNLLSTTNLTIKEISGVAGFNDPLYFGRCFKQSTGQTPSEYRIKK